MPRPTTIATLTPLPAVVALLLLLLFFQACDRRDPAPPGPAAAPTSAATPDAPPPPEPQAPAREPLPPGAMLFPTGDSHVARFRLAYHLDFEGLDSLPRVRANDLHLALSLLAKTKGIPYPYRNPKQLGRRLVNDIDTLREAGIAALYQKAHAGVLVYSFRLRDPADG